MLKKALVLIGLTLSLSTNAAIIDLGNITRDTVSGLDWLDLTETKGRSYNDISVKFGVGGEFEGWRYANTNEALDLFANIGMQVPNYPYITKASTDGTAFIIATGLLGNIYNEYDDRIDYGFFGMTSTMSTSAVGPRDMVGGYSWSDNSNIYVCIDTSCAYASDNEIALWTGSFLVSSSEVPVPGTIWLFGSALACLVRFARNKSN